MMRVLETLLYVGFDTLTYGHCVSVVFENPNGHRVARKIYTIKCEMGMGIILYFNITRIAELIRGLFHLLWVAAIISQPRFEHLLKHTSKLRLFNGGHVASSWLDSVFSRYRPVIWYWYKLDFVNKYVFLFS